MNNNIFTLEDGSYIGYGILKDIDSYILEDGENLKIKYNVHIQNEDNETTSFYHKGGKPDASIYENIGKKMFFIVDKSGSIKYLSDILTNTKMKSITKENLKDDEFDYDIPKFTLIMTMFLILLMSDVLFIGRTFSELVINSTITAMIFCSYILVKRSENKVKKAKIKEHEIAIEELKKWSDNISIKEISYKPELIIN